MKALSANQKMMKYDASKTVDDMRHMLTSIVYRYARTGNVALLVPFYTYEGVAGFINAANKAVKALDLPKLPDDMNGFKQSDDMKRAKKRFQKSHMQDDAKKALPETDAMQAIYDWLFPAPKQSTPKEKTQVQVWKAALKKLESFDLETLPSDAHLPIQDAIAALEADIDQAEALAAALKNAK